jgi:tetratricopeptide (TPR) repeat protein/predicted AlkP superfamily phosphohydrolase/phosphomutase
MASGKLRLRADRARASALARAFPRGWGEGGADAMARMIGNSLAGYASGLGFADLVDPARQPEGGIPPPVAVDLPAMGWSVEAGGFLRFYPATEPARSDLAAPATAGRRVLLIGLDGADWEIIDPLMSQGRMPNLKRLVEGGVRARLKTITPVLSPIIWTSIATGVGPERHGIVDFLATSKTTGHQIPVTSNMRQVKAIWNILSERGIASGIIGWWATWPAERIDGFIVSDRVAYQLFGYPDSGQSLRGRTFPESLALVIQPLIVAPSQVTGVEVERVLPPVDTRIPEAEALTQKLRTILASTRTYQQIGLDLMTAYDPGLKAIYLEGTDTIAHNFMRYRPPRMAGVSEEQVAAYGAVVDNYYQYTDQVLGELLSQADPRTVVVLCSDHGFRSGSSRPASDPRIEKGGAADWHRKFGILAIAGPGIRRGAVLDDVSVLDITPTVLALMGLPGAADMTGRALTEAFETPPALGTIATYEGGEPAPTGGADPVGSAVDDEIVAKLTALGYISQEGSNALNNTGITLIDQGRFSEAAEIFRRALQQTPGFIHAKINLGRAQMLMKDFDGAISTLQEALRIDPAQAEVHDLLGNIYMDRGDTRAAEVHFKRSLALLPDDTNAHNSLGLLYDRTGRDELAIQEYQKVISIDPDYAEGYNNIGLLYRKRGDPRRAIELFDQAIRSDPDFPGSYNNMGLAYQDMGNLADARAAFVRGLRIDPSNAVILNNLGTVDLAEKLLDAAKARFEEAIKADPEYSSAYNNLGAVLGMMGRGDDAFEQYLKAVEIDPNYTDARFNLARVLIERGKNQEAAGMLEKVLAIDPHYSRAHLQLGILLAQQGDLDGAVRRLAEAAREMPDSPDPHNFLAEIHARRGQTEAARRELQTSLALRPDQPQARQMLLKLSAGAKTP